MRAGVHSNEPHFETALVMGGCVSVLLGGDYGVGYFFRCNFVGVVFWRFCREIVTVFSVYGWLIILWFEYCIID